MLALRRTSAIGSVGRAVRRHILALTRYPEFNRCRYLMNVQKSTLTLCNRPPQSSNNHDPELAGLGKGANTLDPSFISIEFSVRPMRFGLLGSQEYESKRMASISHFKDRCNSGGPEEVGPRQGIYVADIPCLVIHSGRKLDASRMSIITTDCEPRLACHPWFSCECHHTLFRALAFSPRGSPGT